MVSLPTPKEDERGPLALKAVASSDAAMVVATSRGEVRFAVRRGFLARLIHAGVEVSELACR